MATKEKEDLGSVLVIGGCGFVGHHVVKQLLFNYDCKISVLDLRTVDNRQPKVEYYDGDITSRNAVLSIFQKVKPKVVIHTASPSAIYTSSSAKVKRATDQLFYKVNVNGTKNILECAVEIGTVKAFVYTSSSSVIHDTHANVTNADEKWPVLHYPLQKNYYAETKGLAEEAVLAYNRQQPPSDTSSKPKSTDMLTCAIRPSSVFGEGDPQMIPKMINAYWAGQTRFQLGQNENLYDYSYVGNVAHAHLIAAEALLATAKLGVEPLDHEKVDGQAFFITNGSPVYFWDFARTVWKAAGDKTEPRNVWVIDTDVGLVIGFILEWLVWLFTFGGSPKLTTQVVRYGSMTKYYSIEKAHRRLGYVPIWDLEEGVARSVKWYLEKEGKTVEKEKQ